MGTGENQALTSPLGRHESRRLSLPLLPQGCSQRGVQGSLTAPLAPRPTSLLAPFPPWAQGDMPSPAPRIPPVPGGLWGWVSWHSPQQGSPQYRPQPRLSRAPSCRGGGLAQPPAPSRRGYLLRAHSSHTAAPCPRRARLSPGLCAGKGTAAEERGGGGGVCVLVSTRGSAEPCGARESSQRAPGPRGAEDGRCCYR